MSVPRPTETLVPSISATPGYSAASFRLRMFGEGSTHIAPVESYQSPRSQPRIGTTVRSASIFFSSLNSLANSPMVMPWRTGSG